MKINAIDEYGLRILIRIAKAEGDEGLSISQISDQEGLSIPYVAKITRTLRAHNLINSTRGHKGGYVLAKPANQININEALAALGGALYDPSFCGSHSGERKFCTNSIDCSVRSLWRMVQASVNQILESITIADLMGTEKNATLRLQSMLDEITQNGKIDV